MAPIFDLHWFDKVNRKEKKSDSMETPPMDTPAASGDLIPRRGSTSAVWKYFGFEKTDVTQKTVICKVC